MTLQSIQKEAWERFKKGLENYDFMNDSCSQCHSSIDIKKIESFFDSLISSSVQKGREEAREEINDFCADERDKAEESYKKDSDDYSQGYYIAMNTVMKHLESSLPEDTV